MLRRMLQRDQEHEFGTSKMRDAGSVRVLNVETMLKLVWSFITNLCVQIFKIESNQNGKADDVDDLT